MTDLSSVENSNITNPTIFHSTGRVLTCKDGVVTVAGL